MKISPKCLTLVLILVGALLVSVPSLGASPADDELVRQAARNLQQENYEEALAQLTKAWQTGPHTAEKAFYLGVVYRQLLDYPKARDYLEEAVRLKPNYMEARKLLADTLITLDKPDLALIQLQGVGESRLSAGPDGDDAGPGGHEAETLPGGPGIFR